MTRVFLTHTPTAPFSAAVFVLGVSVGIDSDMGTSDIHSGNQLVTRYSAIRQFVLDGRVQLI